MPDTSTGCKRIYEVEENDLLTIKGESPIDKNHLIAVAEKAVEGTDIVKTGEPEEYGSEENPSKVSIVVNETVSSQGEDNSEEELLIKENGRVIGMAQGVTGQIGRKDRPARILLATDLPEVQILHFGREDIGDSSENEGRRIEVDEEKGEYEKEAKHKEDGLEKAEMREVDKNGVLEKKNRESEIKLKPIDLLQESSRSVGRIQFKFEADRAAVLLEDRSLRKSDSNSAEGIQSDSGVVSLKKATCQTDCVMSPGLELEENSKEVFAGEFLLDARPFEKNNGCELKCSNLSDQETQTKEQKTLEGSSIDTNPLKDDFAEGSFSGVDSSNEESDCGKECRNRVHEEGFPEEQESTQCPKGMMLDVWGYCRFEHFFASTHFLLLTIKGGLITMR